ncbi:LpqB family beta-propeller domain-containing protein [Pseudarthrobacter sp. J1738]|uniref:LpqB family beta-propeller domain-containing protein n=1 Tax=unclassified Pseudarthrobacter TaxID=2647000 RepID=UPI003D2D1DDE
MNRRSERRRWAVAVVIMALFLSGCAQIPSSGPVTKSQDESSGQLSDATVYYPSGPRTGSSPQGIVEDFYNAGNSHQDDYAVARQFLTQSTSVSWKPDQRTLVYRSAKVVPGGKANDFNYQLDVAYSVDSEGIATQFPSGTIESVPVTLAQVDGQWRISQVQDGTIIPEEIYRGLYQPYTIYFYDPSFQYAVPDVRWFINRASVTKSIVSALLAGPAPYLKDAVVSAFPSGTQLARESVPVVSGAAQVDLTEDLLETSVEDRQRMLNQLTLSFRGQSTVVSVQLRAGQNELHLEDAGTVSPPIVDKNVPSWQIAVANHELVKYENNKTERITGLKDTSALGPRYPAAAPASASYAFLNDQRTTMYTIVPGQSARAVTTRSRLSRPSFDPQNWVWTAGPGGTGAEEIVAYRPDGVREGATMPSVILTPSWLAGRAVKEFQVSRDGTRALVISSANGSTAVQLVGIVRSSDGTPRELTSPMTLPSTSSPDQGVWVSDSTVAVMATSATASVTPELLTLRSGQAQNLPALQGLLALSAGNGVQDLYARTKDGILQRVGNSWAQQTTGVLDPKFPG